MPGLRFQGANPARRRTQPVLVRPLPAATLTGSVLLPWLVCITDDQGTEYRYVGKARNRSRLNEYRNNMLKIKAGRERGKTQKYRAVHFVLYSALLNGWRIEFNPLKNCTKEEAGQLETKEISDLDCNLNGRRGWRVSEMRSLSIETFFPLPRA